MDEQAEREFNKIMDATAYVAHTLNMTEMNSNPMSLGDGFDLVVRWVPEYGSSVERLRRGLWHAQWG